MSQTKEQHKVYMRDWSKANQMSVKATQQKVRINRRELILASKNKPCADCLGWFNSWQMQFDHRPNELKRFNIGGAWTRSLEDLVVKINKCDVVCANCHADRTQQRRKLK